MSEETTIASGLLDGIKKNARVAVIVGILMVICGILAIGSPLVAGMSVTVVVGVMLLIGGIAQCFLAFQAGARMGRYAHTVQQPREQVLRCGPVESLRRGCAVGPADQVIVQHGQRLQLPQCEPVQRMMLQRKLAVATLHTGTAPLEQVGTGLSLAF